MIRVQFGEQRRGSFLHFGQIERTVIVGIEQLDRVDPARRESRCPSGAPAPVEDSVIDFLRAQADERSVILARTNLKAGDEVRIAKGPFKGLAGIMQEPPDARSRVKVLMAILSRQVQVEVPADYVEIAWIAPCTV
jgi:transcription antitermination factor NusG